MSDRANYGAARFGYGSGYVDVAGFGHYSGEMKPEREPWKRRAKKKWQRRTDICRGCGLQRAANGTCSCF